MNEEQITFGGIDYETGEYLFPEMTRKNITGMGASTDKDYLAALASWWDSRQDHFGMSFGYKYDDLADAGWGVLFAKNEDPGVYEQLKPLLDFRKEQAKGFYKDGGRYAEWRGDAGYVDKLKKRQFLRANKAAISGDVDPRVMPYYILIVGSPEAIPYEFQYDLDVQYGVGRIYFDKLEDYGQYARGVIAAEKGEVKREKKATFFGVGREGDRATMLSSKFLVDPLHKLLSETYSDRWKLEAVMRDEATKSRLTSILGGPENPALLFTASHGVGGTKGTDRQKTDQGALVCQDWPGREFKGDMRPMYFAAEDLASDANVAGTVAMMFACYGGGTPKLNEFVELDKAAWRARYPGQEPKVALELADQPFMAALPKRMLSHPKGSALAVIAHMDRSMSGAFQDTGQSEGIHIANFESAMKKLLEGLPVGYAMESFNIRQAELGNILKDSMLELKESPEPSIELVNYVTEYYDARNYIVIGDPAVKLAV